MLCKKEQVDLVVFPEAYERQEGRQIQDVLDGFVTDFGVPVLMGIRTDDGFQIATYSNPNRRPGDTATHLYVKHSSAAKLAFEWPNYRQARERMFTPLVLNGHKLSVQICHDMYFGRCKARPWHTG